MQRTEALVQHSKARLLLPQTAKQKDEEEEEEEETSDQL